MNLPTIVFVHGMWGGPDVWNKWLPHFERSGFSVDAVTLPGHGNDDGNVALERLGLSDYARAIREKVRSFTTPPVLVGHSLGGLVVQLVASDTPVSALVLISASVPPPIWPLRPKVIPAFARHLLRWKSWQRSFRLSRWEAEYLLMNALPQQLRPAVHRGLRSESGKAMWETGFGFLDPRCRHRVNREAIQCSILAFAGYLDRAVPVGASRAMARWYGTVIEYREFKNHGHWMLEEPGCHKRAEEICEWLHAVMNRTVQVEE